jgi:hypothetical protein
MAEIIAPTNAAAEGTFTVSGTTSIQVTGLTAQEWVTLSYQYNSTGDYYPVTSIGKGGRIDNKELPKVLIAPGNYKITKGVTTKNVAVATIS